MSTISCVAKKSFYYYYYYGFLSDCLKWRLLLREYIAHLKIVLHQNRIYIIYNHLSIKKVSFNRKLKTPIGIIPWLFSLILIYIMYNF